MSAPLSILGLQVLKPSISNTIGRQHGYKAREYHIVATMKRSEVLYRTMIAMFVALVIAAYTTSQEVIDDYELVFYGAVMLVMGWLSIQAYVDDMTGN